MKKKIATFCFLLVQTSFLFSQEFKLTPAGYFKNGGADLMVFSDMYPEGHQGGVTLVMNSHRVAANGDVRFEATPGQWQPFPIFRGRKVNEKDHSISVTLSYPDSLKHLAGFNPTIYPDYVFNYKIKVKSEGDHLILTVDLDNPIPKRYQGKIGFNLELYPGSNTSSFVSGVGAKSQTVAYAVNRADWSYIPGGVSPGTALICPDLPELLVYPFLWQEGECCIGGEASYFIYLVLSAQKILSERNK